jgi:hypothetical protein
LLVERWLALSVDQRVLALTAVRGRDVPVRVHRVVGLAEDCGDSANSKPTAC